MSKPWKLQRTVQCAKCPWRKDVNPHDIPNGYDPAKHAALENTIAKEGDLRAVFSGELRIMACHETHESHCLGWLMHQAGPGNNIALRMHLLSCQNFKDVRLIGEQHENFEDTLPQ